MAKTQVLDESKKPEQDDAHASEVDRLSKMVEICNALVSQVQELAERLARVEQMAHTDHTLGSHVVDQIAAHAASHAIHHVDAHLHKVLGHSGLPMRGDQ
jgi:hypothetical protein